MLPLLLSIDLTCCGKCQRVCFQEQRLLCSCVKLLIYSIYPVKLRKQDNHICSGLLWNTRRGCSQRGAGARHARWWTRKCRSGSCRQRDWRDDKPAGEARRRKPTREVCSSAPDRTLYGSRCRDLIDQPECVLEVLIGWEPHTNGRSRTF